MRSPETIGWLLAAIFLLAWLVRDAQALDLATTHRSGDVVKYHVGCLDVGDAANLAAVMGLSDSRRAQALMNATPCWYITAHAGGMTIPGYLSARLIAWESGPYQIAGQPTSVWKATDRDGPAYIIIPDGRGPHVAARGV